MRILQIIFTVILMNFFCINLLSAAELKVVTSDDLTRILKQRDDSKKILLFFTSWCSHCKGVIEQIIYQKNENKIVFISLDKEFNKIQLMAQQMPENMIVYYLKNTDEVLAFFAKFGIKYKNSIPYITILDEDSDLLIDDINIRQLYRYLK